jgi:hypothetical protein
MLSIFETTKSPQLQCTTASTLKTSTVYYCLFQCLVSWLTFISHQILSFSQRLEGNPLCNDSLLSDTTPCTGLQTEAPPQPVLFDVQCANPFIETVVFRAPSFTNVLEYLPVLEKNLSSQLKSCTPNRIGLTSYSNEVAYLNVDIKATRHA